MELNMKNISEMLQLTDQFLIESIDEYGCESTEELLETLGNIPPGSEDLIKTMRTQTSTMLGSKSKIHEPEHYSEKTLSRHITSLRGWGKKDASPSSEHAATIVHVNGKPHSIITPHSIYHREEKRYGWNNDVGPKQLHVTRKNRESTSSNDIKDHVSNLVRQNGADNVKLQMIGSDPKKTQLWI